MQITDALIKVCWRLATAAGNVSSRNLASLPSCNGSRRIRGGAPRLGSSLAHVQGVKSLIPRAAEDADLIRQAAWGSVEAYNVLVSRWENRVYNYLLHLTGNRVDAQDLTQDVFLKVYQNLARLDNLECFGPWLYRIAHNHAYSMFRRRRAGSDPDKIEPEGVDYGITVGGISVFPLELRLSVAAALDRLSPDQREVVDLKIYQGFKFEEMAEILSCPVSTIKSRLYSALDLLKNELAPIRVAIRAARVA